MNIFDHNSGDYEMIDLTSFFEDIKKDAMNTGYELFILYGIKGMQEELGSKNPVRIANKLINFFIEYEEYEKCAELKKIINKYKQEYKQNKKKSYEN